MMSSKHHDFLRHHCRVCCKVFGKSKYACAKYSTVLHKLGVDIASDDSLIHPEYFCSSCYLMAKRVNGYIKLDTRSSVEWTQHNDTFCSVCDVRCKGGRPKQSSRGRPTKIHQHITSVALKVPHFSLDQIVDTTCKTYVTCSCCHLAANEPVRIVPCQSLICRKCCATLVSEVAFDCPGCSSHHDTSSSIFSELSSLEEKMLKDMLATCKKCNKTVKLERIDEVCESHGEESRTMSLEDVINQPLVAKPSKLESQAAIKVVSRMMHQNDGTTCTLSTGGRVSTKYIIIIKLTLIMNYFTAHKFNESYKIFNTVQ